MKSFVICAVGLLLVLLAPGAMAQTNSDNTRPTPAQQAEIRALYQRLLTADAQRDTGAFARILAPAYTFVPPRGDTILTREQRIAGAATDTGTVRPKYTLHDCRTQVHGTIAVAHCRYTATVTLPGATSDSSLNFISTAVFLKQGHQWQIVATHPSLVRQR